MDNMNWFDSYRGPKRIMVEQGQATCWIGFSVAMANGGVMRKDLYTYGPTLGKALAEAREVYESIPKKLPVSNVLDFEQCKFRSNRQPTLKRFSPRPR
jgi:hypothetical protein